METSVIRYINNKKYIYFKKHLKRRSFVGFGPACKNLESIYSIWISKNQYKLKNQQLFLGLSEKWGAATKLQRQVYTGNHNLPEQNPPIRFLCRNQYQSRKTRTVIDKLLAAQCLRYKNLSITSLMVYLLLFLLHDT